MLEAILETLKIMGWLGIVLFILVITNIISGTLVSVWSGESSFSWKRMLTGVIKAIVFYISAICVSVAFTLIPFISDMITSFFDVTLFPEETLNIVSSVGILGIVVSAIIFQGKKAITNVLKLANLSSDTEQITWEVEEDDEDAE